MDLDNISPSRSGVAAISQPSSFLELNIVSVTQQAAESAIRKILRAQEIPEPENDEFVPANVPNVSVSVQQLLDDLPFPPSILKSAIHNLRLFETVSLSPSSHTRKSTRTAFIPSPRLLLQAYKHLYNASLLTDISLSSGPIESSSLAALLDSVHTDEGEMFASVAEAILLSFSDSSPNQSISSQPSESKEVKVRTDITARELCDWLGRLILYCHAIKPLTSDSSSTTQVPSSETEQGLAVDLFHEEWLSVVPQSWHNLCSLATIEDSLSNSIIIKDGVKLFDLQAFGPFTALFPEFDWYTELHYSGQDGDGGHGPSQIATSGTAGTNIGGNEMGKAKSSKTTGQGQRKWHEKFGAMREKK